MEQPTKTRRKPLKALLLDLDGTVVDTHELIFQSYCHTIREYLGVEVDRQVWAQSVGLPLQDMFRAMFTHGGQSVSEAQLDAAVQTYRAHMRANDTGVTAFPGIPDTLATFKNAGVRLAIVTTKHQALALRHLEFIGLKHWFEAVITGDQCTHCKPHPEPFLRALDVLGVAAEEAAGVGDSPFDVESSRAAGVLAVAACWGTANRTALLAAQPDYALESPQDLLRFI